MPTLNPRITFTVSDETMKAIDEYRFSHRMGFKRPRVQISPPRPQKALKTRSFRGFCYFYKMAENGIKLKSTAYITAYKLSGGSCLLYCAVEIPSSAPSRVQTAVAVLAT